MNNLLDTSFTKGVITQIMAERNWTTRECRLAQIGKLSEEVGEAVKEGNMLTGNSRHRCSDLAFELTALAEELADVIITAQCMAYAFGIGSLDGAINAKIGAIQRRGGY